MIKLRLQRLDRRYSGSNRFSHRVEFSGGWKSKAINFVHARNWCWGTFGPSSELDRLFTFDGESPIWAWESDGHKTAIYLRDVSLTQFLLVKEQYEVDYD